VGKGTAGILLDRHPGGQQFIGITQALDDVIEAILVGSRIELAEAVGGLKNIRIGCPSEVG
jgi:hypothetical protein